MRKRLFGHMWTANTQISLRTRTVWCLAFVHGTAVSLENRLSKLLILGYGPRLA